MKPQENITGEYHQVYLGSLYYLNCKLNQTRKWKQIKALNIKPFPKHGLVTDQFTVVAELPGLWLEASWLPVTLF